mmetsp:Transcript_21290/g.36550  ORF Transcript_21290/g.36550 Transcript_21290/m.36550 type:complete len:344 (+) Transcript_21290:96-1127(+)
MLSVREPFIVSDRSPFGMYPNESCVFLKKRCVFHLLEADGRVILFADGDCYLNNKRMIFTPLKTRDHRSFNFPLRLVEDETVICRRGHALDIVFRPSGIFGSNSEAVPLLCRVILQSEGIDFCLSFLSFLLQIRFSSDVLHTKLYPVPVPAPLEPWYALNDNDDSVHSTRSYPEISAMANHIYRERFDQYNSISVSNSNRSLRRSLSSHVWKSATRKVLGVFKSRCRGRRRSRSDQSCFVASASALNVAKGQEAQLASIPQRTRLAIQDPRLQTLELYEQLVDNSGRLLFASELSIEKPSREYGPDSLHSSLRLMNKLSKCKTRTSSFASDAFLTLVFRHESG